MTVPYFEDPETTREEILAAAYRALRTHGYADLTIQKIGDELEKSPSLVYHHYENKDDLLVACLEFMLEQFESEMTTDGIDDPRRSLEAFLEGAVPVEEDPDRTEFARALLELRVQAGFDPSYREHFVRSDQLFQDRIAAIIRAGIAEDVFQECDAEQVAATLFTLLTGGFVRQATTDHGEWALAVRAEIDEYLQERVYRS
ncbi:TetR/AcrR family transcriptional regulator [Halopiger djelfimassiliensis]|uniref:TetR/AcrR family transcriptional regulator n=1 Tax=Halopiger djelfimassiliensis TaxID=1293047 RepID=UPI000677DCC7|nr:TetR/AcrR family transcriptional regulator [Halopiger djelfimassiliensis]